MYVTFRRLPGQHQSSFMKAQNALHPESLPNHVRIGRTLLKDCVAMRKEYRKLIKASVQAQVHHSHHFGAWFAADASRRERHVSDEATKLVGRIQRLQQERRTVEAEKEKMKDLRLKK